MPWETFQRGRRYHPAPTNDTGPFFELNEQVKRLNGLNYNAPRWNVKEWGATGDGTTDDTAAFVAANAARMALKGQLYPGGAEGWYGKIPTLWVPPGNYKISSSDAFIPLGMSSGTGIEGFHIRGEPQATRILFSGSDYAIKNQQKNGYSIYEGLQFIADGSNRKGLLLNQTSGDGLTQNFQINNVGFSGFKEAITVTGTSNASELHLTRVGISNIPADGTGFLLDNEQAVNIILHGCTIHVTNASAIGIIARAGGMMIFDGGNLIVEHGLAFAIDSTGATGGTWGYGNSIFSLRGIRPELRDTDAKLIRINGVVHVKISDSLLGPYPGVTHPADTIHVNLHGELTIDHCDMPPGIKMTVTTQDNASYVHDFAPEIIITNSAIGDLWDMVTFAGGGNVYGSLGRVSADGCRRWGYGDAAVREPVDVELNARFGWRSHTIKRKTFVWTWSPDKMYGLPMHVSGGTETATTAKMIPRGATLVRVGIFRTAFPDEGATPFTSAVKLWDDTSTNAVLTSLAGNVDGVAWSQELYLYCDTDAKRVLKVSGTGTRSTGAVPGFVVAEYI